MTNCFFITGTDTNVGKTIVSCALIQIISNLGYKVAGYKPVSTGCISTSEGLRNQDALDLLASSNVKLTYEQINPIKFIEPTSPNIASEYENKPIKFSVISLGKKKLSSLVDWLIIEGVGGWLTPISNKLSLEDWIIYENIPVILVVGIKIGCINHALLTQSAILRSKTRLVGWIANSLNEKMPYYKQYIKILKERLNAPMLGTIPWIKKLNNSSLIKDIYLTIPK